MKKLGHLKANYVLAIFAIVLFSTSLTGQIPDPKPIEPYEMGQILQQKIIEDKLNNIADELTDIELWSNTIYSDSLLEIVYQPEGLTGDLVEGDLTYDINSPAFITAKNKVIDLVVKNNSPGTGNDIVFFEDDEEPILILRVDSYESVYALRNSGNVHLIALGGFMNEKYETDLRNGINSLPEINDLYFTGFQTDRNEGKKNKKSNVLLWILDTIDEGCGNSAADEEKTKLVLDNHVPAIDGNQPILRVPWHYEEMDILKANRCAAGAEVKIALLDSGVSQDQVRLGDKFNATYTDREIIKRTVFSDGDTDDDCGHGTHMAGVIAGPKYDTAVRGVAYESDLVSMRSNKDVLLLSIWSKAKLKKALKVIRKEWQGTGGVKIMSMSLGYLTYSPSIAKEIKKLDQKGVLMFAAIGTSPKKHDGWVKKVQIFPARNHRTQGVTGVFRKAYSDPYEFCDKCHYGNRVDFIVPMQYSYGINTHSLMEQGAAPSKVGGSSIATATMAGVAALVWGLPENQNKSDEQIVQILANACTDGGGDYGYGVVDVAVATGCTAPDPEVVFELQDAQGTPRSNFSICEDIFINSTESIADDIGHFIRLKSVVNGEPDETLVNTSWTAPFPGTLPILNLTDIIANEEEDFSFTPGETYEVTFGIKDATFGWFYEYTQFTLQQIPVSGVLPGNGSTGYNYGVENASIIGSFDINAGGELRVNDIGATGFIPGTGPDAILNTYYAEIRSYCAGPSRVVTVNDGGRFILGNDPSDDESRTAIVTVKAGNTVHVKTGGILRLTRGSQLIIEEGAKLIIEQGAFIDLWWNNSTIRIKGELDLQGEFNFSGSGFIQFDNSHTLTLSSTFTLEGQSISHRFLRLNSGTTLDIDGHDLNLKYGTVEIADGAMIRIGPGGRVTTNYNVLTSTEGPSFTYNTGLHLYNPSSVNIYATRIENLYTGIEATSLAGTDNFSINIGRFNNNENSIKAKNGLNVNIQNSFFEAMDKGYLGIELRNISNAILGGNKFNEYPSDYLAALHLINVADAQVNYTSFTNNEVSVRLENVFNFAMNGGSITHPATEYTSESSIGINVPYLNGGQVNVSNVALRSNAKIKHQDKGIYVAKGGYTDGTNQLFGRVLMDCAKLIGNDVSILGEDVTLEIDALVHCNCTDIADAKPNTFIRYTGPQGGGEQHFDICYDLLNVNEVLANGNYWSDEPSSDGFYIEDCNSNNDIPLITDVQAVNEPTGCTFGGPVPDPEPGPVKGEVRSTDSTSPDEIALDDNAAMTIYPNPTNGHFSILLNPGAYTIRIFDLTGKEIFNQSGMEANSALDSRGWPKGIYFVEAMEESTHLQSQVKLLVQ